MKWASHISQITDSIEHLISVEGPLRQNQLDAQTFNDVRVAESDSGQGPAIGTPAVVVSLIGYKIFSAIGAVFLCVYLVVAPRWSWKRVQAAPLGLSRIMVCTALKEHAGLIILKGYSTDSSVKDDSDKEKVLFGSWFNGYFILFSIGGEENWVRTEARVKGGKNS